MRHRRFEHIVWATRNSEPLLDLATARFLAEYFTRICREEDAWLVQFGAVRTHVHLLIRTHPARLTSRLVQRLKGGSAFYGRREHGLPIRWHHGYSIDSVSLRAVERVADYVANQDQRHPALAIDGWRPTTRHIPEFLRLLDCEWIAGANRRPHGGS